MKVTKVFPGDSGTLTIDTDYRQIHTDHHGCISFSAAVIEDVYFCDASYDVYKNTLEMLQSQYGEGTVINECPGKESTINRITVYKVLQNVFFDTDIIYRAYHKDKSIFQELLEAFDSDTRDPVYKQKFYLNDESSAESERVADAFNCHSMQCISVINTDHKPVTLGRLRNMLLSCSQKGFDDDTPVYIDDGTTVHPIYDEVHPYKSTCGDKRCILMIAEEPKPVG